MDELARTCFRDNAFFKHDKRLPPLVDPQLISKQAMFSEADKLIQQHNADKRNLQKTPDGRP
jgi:hypothetical protein